MTTLTLRYSDTADTRLSLSPRQVVSTEEARGMSLKCLSGAVWITFASGGVDHILGSRDRLAVTERGRMVIEAIDASELVLQRETAHTTNTHQSHRDQGSSPEYWRDYVARSARPLTNIDVAF